MGEGILTKDGNNVKLQKASRISTLDGTGTPQQSPLTVGATEEEIIIPPFCVEILINTDEDIWIDSVTGVSATQGFKILASTTIPIQVKAGDSIFLVQDSAEAKVSVLYQLLEAN